MLVLGIETTCDETSSGIVEDGERVLSNVVFSQIKEHEAWKGVVPEIASRLHIKKISPIVEESLKVANKNLNDIDLIAVATRPGLIGGLVVGASFAKALSWSNNIPFVSVNHVEAHLYSPHLTANIPFSLLYVIIIIGLFWRYICQFL